MGQADAVQHSQQYYHVYSIEVNIALILWLLCSQIEATDPAKKCLDNQFIVVRADGTTSCEDCGTCPKGQGLSHACGRHIDPNAMLTCILCRGNTFSSRYDSSSCAPCSSCAEGQVVLQKCTSTQDVVCDNKCYGLDRYFDESGVCLPCSKCCGDGRDKVKDECKSKLGAASENLCAFNHSGNHCDESTTPTATNASSTEMTRNATSTPNVTATPTQTSASGGSTASTSVSGRSTKGHTQKTIMIVSIVLSTPLVSFFVMKIVTALWKKFNQSCGGNRDVETGPAEAGESSCLMQVSNTEYDANKGEEGKEEEGEGQGEGEENKEEEEEHKELEEKDQQQHGQPMQSTCQNERTTKKVSKPLKDLVNHPSDYLSEICKRLDTRLTGVGYYKEVAKYYNFDMYTIRSFKDCPGGPSNELISAITAKYPKVTVEMFAGVVAKQASREDVAELLRAFDRK
ncbi:tumor necrosis factor receptor superfamily member 16-like [Acropora muricata]|uniref:tumor necrosis factor receptor superfamily member 16-like n=1 Tax=Acropora muricata TaxID=159855 RepID=UPI0034E4AC43